ncbi:copper binding periplasmic CusF family protein [Paraburkholderia fungorum]|jgi:Cu/Ag efflux protein CusF|uniref:Copper binding periplasmic CusF family protein n=1 Tax=Paraburkholderia fungorum TaxID=134537 RepID=A0AAP5UXX6_9BURK|nr:copper-binding protein [Paraburkholderia fungorum]AJZ56770.1 copper binding periplasmic CusF family protein [Paraburkholderia fungorum]MDT8843465.1 copper-binding protein [Paraburkholderia fungorum]PRZ45531.1 Cu/Ag efflux protein CusF [Paraburkholderia fungorum]
MKNVFVSIAVGCALAISASAFAAGATGNMDMGGSSAKPAGETAGMSHGEIRKVDAAAGKLTIKHGPLENLGMDAMTMVFRVKDPAMISQVKIGDKIDFVAEEVDGALTVTKLQKK